MVGISYSVIGIIAIIIHCTINRDVLLLKQHAEVVTSMRYYRKFLWAILLYYITDMMWGILDGLGLVSILRVDTFIYYVAMSVAVVLWCDYVVEYLQQNNFFGKLLRNFGRIFVVFEMLALMLNFYRPFFFWFDEDGTYNAGPIRYVALLIQIVMFMLATIQTVFVTTRTEGVQRRRHMAICLFGLAMIIAIFAQIFYPLLPIYTIGYLIGACSLHVFVGEDEKDEYINDLQRQMDIVSAMSSIFFCSYYIDMKSRTFVEIDNKITENSDFIGKSGDAVKTLDKVCEHLVLPQYMKEMQEFTNLDTLEERLSRKKYYVSCQFESIHLGWAEGYFIASDRDEDGKLKHVIWAIRTIVDEKAKEEKLLYNSYVDELTGLYNRKMYSEDMIENLDKLMTDDFVYIAMDVNGLKNINDSKGHVAGDELIKGAANCMKEVMGPYGRVYRTGGDEFIAMLNVGSDQLSQMKERFETVTANYKGKFIDSVSISCGYVVRRDNPEMDIEQIEKMADKNMYLAKRLHYSTRGVDRREQQQNAYKALCALYSKILMVSFTEDKYSIISMNENEQTEDKGFSDGIFDWLEKFARSGQVHEEDREHFLASTSREYLIDYFKKGNTSLNIEYRRYMDGEFKHVEMLIIPSESYSDENQNMYLYVSRA